MAVETFNIARAKEMLQQAITLCSRRPTYQAAIEVSSNLRALCTGYYHAWFMDTALREHAAGYVELSGRALKALQKSAFCIRPEFGQRLHVHGMIRNARIHQGIFAVIERTEDRGVAANEIGKLHDKAVAEKEAVQARGVYR